jgi:NDP-sugar pyrophosphorylase family protein
LIRGNVIVGAKSVLGNACEYKNCLLMDRVETPHYNYVGDSILGSHSHLGAGAICSNLRLDRQPVTVRGPDVTWDTGLRKFGAILGEQAEVGCNAVLNPGAVLGKRALVMPAMAFGGVLPANQIAKGRSTFSFIPRKD